MKYFSPFSEKVFKRCILAATFVAMGVPSFAQPWMNDSLKNFYDIQRSFNEYWKDRPIEKGKGYKAFKRWEWFWEQRVAPTGEFPNPMQLINERPVLKYPKGDLLLNTTQSNPWTPLGPSESAGGYSGLGRINSVAIHPTNPNIIWVGSGGGGAWKSTDGGLSWSTMTDLLPTLGIGDIAIDPKNPDIIYLATGDGEADDAYSVGVLKSFDGGNTWNATGMNYNIHLSVTMSRILINPDSTNILVVATNNGVYRSDNAGETWKKGLTGNFKDMEFKPGDPSIVYAARSNGAIFRSVNGGTTWTQMKTGLPTSNIGRVALGVTPAETGMIYALFASSNGGFGGLYVSYDSGETWELTSKTPNILSGAMDGNGNGGQGWYDLAIAVSPDDAAVVYIGGINIWRTDDVGGTWTQLSHWYNQPKVQTVHADQHFLYFAPNSSRLYVGNDGGVYFTDNGTQWSWIGNGLQITQFYRLGTSATNPNKYIAGAQDNSTQYFNGTKWSHIETGDGMESAIDPTNENIIYTSSYNGALKRTMNGGINYSGIEPTDEENAAWITPYMLNPQNPNAIFAGYTNVWKSLNNGSSWSIIGNISGNSPLNILKVAPSDSNTIYISTGFGNIRRTTDGATNWTSVSLPLQATLTSLEIHPKDPLKIWATFSGYTTGSKVYTSNDGGAIWKNISKNLPNIPVNTIVYQNNTPDRLYVGTDVGVYHTDSTLSDWRSFNQDLPNVVISELEIQYSAGKLRAATYGRGLWESDIILGTVGVEDENIQDNSPVVVMPNPAQNYISIQSPANNFEKVLLKLVDIQGKEALRTEMTAGENLVKGRINLESVPNGTYFLNIQTASKTYTVKVSVNR